ncbi:Lysosomal-trafficking regulator [Camelus dromedarius]|uniref:Lysosomal-trafficking regulator n=1 Tax=Camelus dromedarius TaxID=9838 RepID=A0A5N4DIC0_CAMDR|nr:Lysosomal-trafficking regulator [Camelus dromedarius]
MLLDNGLLYVLCKTVAALNFKLEKHHLVTCRALCKPGCDKSQLCRLMSAPGVRVSIPSNEHRLLACNIQQLLIAVTVHACSSSGSQYLRVIEDLIVLLGYLQNSKNKRTQKFNPDIIDILSTPENAAQSQTSVSETEISEENIHHEQQPSAVHPFQKEMFTYLVEAFKTSMGSSKTSGPRQQWAKLLGSCKETFRVQLGRLLLHILSPAHPSQERKQIFGIVCEPNHQEILRDS